MPQPRRIALLLMLTMLFSLGATLYRNIPPVSHTNAPGESNCTACHSGTLNGGPGSVSLSGITNYVPGTVYTLSLSLTDNTKSRFGFSLTSLNSSNQAAGTLAVLNATNTSLGSGSVGGGSRQYLSHRNAGSNQNWSFRWTAPSSNIGPVTFYVAGNACNANGSTSGDNVYAQTFVVNPAPTPPAASFTSSAAAACLNQSLTFTNTSSGSINSFNWNFGPGATPATASTAGPHTVSYSSPGATAVRLIVTGPGGADTTESSFTLNALPVADLSGLDPGYCSNEGSVTLSGSPAGGTYTGPGISGSSFNPAAAGPGQHLISYTYVDLNGCSASDTDTTVVAAAPAVSVSPPAPYNLCPGDTLTLDAGAGFASYSWSNGATTQTARIGAPGIYEVIVTAANGCSDTSSFLFVNSYPNPVANISISGDTTFCDGDSAVLDAGAGFAAYLWSNGATGQTLTATSTGFYNVTVTDSNGCSDSASRAVQITALPGPPVPGVMPAGDTVEICEGDTVTLVADTGFVTYQWSTGDFGPSLQVSVPGSFFLIVGDSSSCTRRSAIKQVWMNPLPVPVIGVVNQDTLGTGAYSSYQWAFLDTLSGTSTAIAGATGRQLAAGDYRNDPGFTGTVVVTVTDENGCMGTSDPFAVPAATGLRDDFPYSFQVFPNPVTDQLWVSIEGNLRAGINLSLVDLQGRVLRQQSGSGSLHSLSTGGLAAGLYLLEVRSGSKRSYRKVIKR